MNDEPVRELRPTVKSWTADIGNSRVRHTSGFEVQFIFNRQCQMAAHVVNGAPALEGLDEAGKQLRMAWLKRMLQEAAESFEAAVEANVH